LTYIFIHGRFSLLSALEVFSTYDVVILGSNNNNNNHSPPLHRISLTSVYQRRRSAAVTSCGQPTLIYCTSRGHGQVTVTEVLLYAVRQSGTVCLLAYVLLTLLRLIVDS